MSKIDKLYADKLQQFVNMVNERLRHEKFPQDKLVPIQGNVNELLKELEGVRPDEEWSRSKEDSVGSKLNAIVGGLQDISPQVDETLAHCVPLLLVFMKTFSIT